MLFFSSNSRKSPVKDETTKTYEFYNNAVKEMMKDGNEVTKPYNVAARLGIIQAVKNYHEKTGICPMNVSIHEIKKGFSDDQLIVVILASGNVNKKGCTIKYNCEWNGVRFNRKVWSNCISGAEDTQVLVVNTGKVFYATSGIFKNTLYTR